MKLLHTFNFVDYPEEIELTKTRKAKYYFETDEDIPKKYINDLGVFYDFDIVKAANNESVLVNMKTGIPILRNAHLVNKPRTMKIAGQLLHELRLKDYQRSKILTVLKSYFISTIAKNPVKINIDKPIFIELIFRVERSRLEDLDNYELFYKKTLFDCFVKTRTVRKKDRKTKKIVFESVPNQYGFLTDDNVDFIKGYNVRYRTKHPKVDRVLIVKLFEDDSEN
jgi:hypothetical protein